MNCEVASHQNTVDPLLSPEHPRMYLSVADLHALTVSLTLVDLHQCLHRFSNHQNFLSPLLCCCLFIQAFLCSSIHSFIHQFVSEHSCGQQCVVEKQIVCILSVFLYTSVKKFNKVLNQGHHLRLLCASMTSPSVNP